MGDEKNRDAHSIGGGNQYFTNELHFRLKCHTAEDECKESTA